jgi:hypothetical protein
MKFLGDCLMWAGFVGPFCWIDPRFLSEEWMSSTETSDQAIQRSSADTMAKSFHGRKSA